MDNIEICRAAWNATKKDTQPAYDELIQSYRDMLSARAAKVIREGVISDDALGAFERQVASEAKGELAPTSDQGYEQITDVEPETTGIITTDSGDEPAKPKQGKLPADFPYHDLLAEADINTYAQARKADWTQVAGIGPARAEEIEVALNGS